MSKSLEIPLKLLHEAEGHIVIVEFKSGEHYRGLLIECEDNWSCQLESVTYTAKDGRVSQLEHVFLRGSKIRFMVIPDMLKNVPMLKPLDAKIKDPDPESKLLYMLRLLHLANYAQKMAIAQNKLICEN